MDAKDIFAALKAPFLDKDLEWRVQSGGIKNGNPWALILCYVDARAVMDRLDEVLGGENWQDEYIHLSGGVECQLHFKVGGEWLFKTDGSPETAVEAFKGGYSKALVRCAVKLGIGRYLYNLDTQFANFGPKVKESKHYKGSDSKYYYWLPPRLGHRKI